MSKPHAILIIGDSFSNGDGVYYPSECEQIMEPKWCANVERLLGRYAVQNRGGTPTKSVNDAIKHDEGEWNDAMAERGIDHLITKEYNSSNGNWTSVLEATLNIPVINVSLSGARTKSIGEQLSLWCARNQTFMASHHFFVMCNWGSCRGTSITAPNVHAGDSNGYSQVLPQDANPLTYDDYTGHYYPGSSDFSNSYLEHFDQLGGYKFELAHNLLMLQTTCKAYDMSFCYSGPHNLDGVDTWFSQEHNFLDLPLPTDRCLVNVEPAFRDLSGFTMWSCKDLIADDNFNPYSVCRHYNKAAQTVMAQNLAKLIQDNEQWFWN